MKRCARCDAPLPADHGGILCPLWCINKVLRGPSPTLAAAFERGNSEIEHVGGSWSPAQHVRRSA